MAYMKRQWEKQEQERAEEEQQGFLEVCRPTTSRRPHLTEKILREHFAKAMFPGLCGVPAVEEQKQKGTLPGYERRTVHELWGIGPGPRPKPKPFPLDPMFMPKSEELYRDRIDNPEKEGQASNREADKPAGTRDVEKFLREQQDAIWRDD